MSKHLLISCATYDNDFGMNIIDLNYIPKVLVKKIDKIINEKLDILINNGNFSFVNDESYNYGGVGCGDNLLSFYKNSYGYEFQISYHYEFQISYHYDGSSYVIEINVNSKFENNIEFMRTLNDIKNIYMLNLNIFVKLCNEIISKENCNKMLSEENDD